MTGSLAAWPKSTGGTYAVCWTALAERALAQMPAATRDDVRRQANEIAMVAGTLNPPLAEASGTLRFEVPGHVVNYLVDDASRTLTILRVVAADKD